MGRTLTPEQRQHNIEWAICLKSCAISQDEIARKLGVSQRLVSYYLSKNSVSKDCFIVTKNNVIIHNDGTVIHNFNDGWRKGLENPQPLSEANN